MRGLPVVLLLPSCMFVVPCPDCDELLTCHDVAIVDANGDADVCDVAACSHCVETCGADCVVRESYPPSYACPDAAWDVFDECPSWQPPTTAPHATDVAELGCGEPAEPTLTATSTVAGRIDVDHVDYALGCCPQALHVDVAVSGATLLVDYSLIDDFCDCACMLDTTYAIVDVPSGTWEVRSRVDGVSDTVTVP